MTSGARRGTYLETRSPRLRSVREVTREVGVEGVLSPISLDTADVALALAVGRALFLWALNPMLLTRPETGVILDANPAASQAIGLSVRELRSRKLNDFRDRTDTRWASALRQRARTGRFISELSVRSADGTVFPAEVSSYTFDVGGRHYAVVIMRDISERKALESQLREALTAVERLAVSDDLTGLFNRRGLSTVGRQLIEEARRQQHPVSLLVLDVDGLKAVNDRHGHAVGDEMLRDVTAALTSGLRTADVIARIGGDEFAVILSGVQADSDAALAVRRINAYLARRARRENRPYQLTVSAGAAIGYPDVTYDLDSLLRAADEAMYNDKRRRAPRRPRPRRTPKE